jgi:molybdate transport system regulatory protein
MRPSRLHFAQALGHEALDKRLDILRRIGEAGSISEAARGAGISYKAAWQALENLSNLAGAHLIEKVVGGSGGGGTRLTDAGQQLLEAADRLSDARRSVLAELEQRTDSALNLPSLIGLGLRTSMRNQLPCIVESISKKAGIARVRLALPTGEALTSRITSESAELLGLNAGMTVVALCKATAVTVKPSCEAREGLNRLHGTIIQITSADDGGEVAVELMRGLQLIGFPAEHQMLSMQQRVVASLDEAAVVIAIAG